MSMMIISRRTSEWPIRNCDWRSLLRGPRGRDQGEPVNGRSGIATNSYPMFVKHIEMGEPVNGRSGIATQIEGDEAGVSVLRRTSEWPIRNCDHPGVSRASAT